METNKSTPAETFPYEVNQAVASLEREGARKAMRESQERSVRTQTRLRDALIQAWRDMVEETSTSEALEVIAAEAHGLAEECGKFTQQERYLLAASLFGLSEDARKAGL